jgi:hypothetical protein
VGAGPKASRTWSSFLWTRGTLLFLNFWAPEKFEIKFRFFFSYQLAERDFSQAFIFTAKRKDKPFRGLHVEREYVRKNMVSVIYPPPPLKQAELYLLDREKKE